jgi:hypothetical protein
MRLLIDTQIFIWVVLDSDKLGAKARQVMLAAAEYLFRLLRSGRSPSRQRSASSKEIPTNLWKQLKRVVSESL